MLALRVGQRVAVVEHGVDAVGDEAVARPHDLGRRAHDDGVGRDDGVVGDVAVAGDDAVLADHHALHDGGADADQAVVADGAAVQHHAVRDRAVVADDGRRAVADVHHHVVLQVAAAADAHVGALGADHGIGPQARILADLHLAVDARGRDRCRPRRGSAVAGPAVMPGVSSMHLLSATRPP